MPLQVEEIYNNFAERLQRGALTIKEQLDILYGPASSPLKTKAKEQRDYLIFEAVILKSIEREIEEIQTAQRLAKELAAAEYKAEPKAAQPELSTPAKQTYETAGMIDNIKNILAMLLAKLTDLIKKLDMQIKYILQLKQHIMNQVVLPALTQLRPNPAIPIFHQLHDGTHIILNPHMESAYQHFYDHVYHYPHEIGSEQQFDDVFDRSIDAIDIRNVHSARGVAYPHALEHDDVHAMRHAIRHTFRQHPQYKDIYEVMREAVAQGLGKFQILDCLQEFYQSNKAAAEDALHDISQAIRIPQPIPALKRIVEAGENIYNTCTRELNSVSQQISESGLFAPPPPYNPELDHDTQQTLHWPPRLAPRNPGNNGNGF